MICNVAASLFLRPVSVRFRHWIATKDVVFVAGLYKSATSLIVRKCAEFGLSNPSAYTNQLERAYGRSKPRYLTHECQEFRTINKLLRMRRDCRGTIRPVEQYLQRWGRHIVVKDPRLVFTIHGWLNAAERAGFRPGVILSWRPFDELKMAWEFAPFTERLIRLGCLPAHILALHELAAWCRRRSVPTFSISYADAILLDREVARL